MYERFKSINPSDVSVRRVSKSYSTFRTLQDSAHQKNSNSNIVAKASCVTEVKYSILRVAGVSDILW
jgi:hypothetical protein